MYKIALLALVACENPQTQREDLEGALGWTDGFETVTLLPGDTDEPTTTTEQVSENLFYLDAPTLDYTIRLQTWDPDTRTVNTGEACQIDLELLKAGDHVVQYCMMDVNELDLKVLGYQLDVNIPGGTCDFYQVDWYQYEDWQSDLGPTELNIRINPDGSITDDPNTFFGEPFCFAYDYRPYGPNCCLGGYVLNVDDQMTGQLYSIPGQWGGYPGDCYDGTSYIMSPGESLDTHLPLSKIVFTDKDAYKAHYDVVGDADEYGSNIGTANYYDPADHNDEKPAGLLRPYSREYNAFYCLDDAAEIYAEIRLIVRDWNTEEQFNVQGDFDEEGFEVGPAGEPDSRSPLNDIGDWRDMAPTNVVWTNDRD